MPFSLSGNIITQTGTDTITAADSIAGTTKQLVNELVTVFDFGDNILLYEGVINIDDGVAFHNIQISNSSSGVLNCGVDRPNPTDYKYNYGIDILSIQNRARLNLSTPFNIYGQSVFINSERFSNTSSDMEWKYARVHGNTRVDLIGAGYLVENTHFIITGTFPNAHFVRSNASSWNNNIIDAEDTNSYFALSTNTRAGIYNFDNIELLTNQALIGYGSATVDAILNLSNVSSGLDYILDVTATTSTRNFTLQLNHSFDDIVQDANFSTIADARVFLDGGSGTVQIENTDAQGRASQVFRYQNNVVSSGVSAITNFVSGNIIFKRIISYNHLPSSQEIIDIRSSSGNESITTLLTDQSISNLDQVSVAAYTDIINAQTFYDRAKSYLVDNYAGEAEVFISRNGNAIDLKGLDLIIDASAADVFDFDGSTITIRSSSYSGLITTTGTVTLVNGAVQSGGIIDANGILVGVSSDAMFNIIARHSAMAAGVYYPYQENVDNAAFTVPAGETLEIAMWQLGKQVLYQRIDPAATPSFNARFIDHPFVDANIDVTTILDTIDVALSPTQYSVTFNAPLDIGIEQVKTVLHHIFGQAPSLIASLAAGEGPRAIEIRTDEIAINSPIIKALRGPGLTTSQDVILRAFFNDANALALDPNYTLTPQDVNNMRVQTLIEKPSLDPAQLANAVWGNPNGVATLGHARAANIQTQK